MVRVLLQCMRRTAFAAVFAVGLVFVLALSTSARAQKSSTKVPAAKTSAAAAASDATSKLPQSVVPKFTERTSVDELSFIMKFESFLNRDRPPAGVPDYSQIGAHFRTESEGRIFRGTLELGGSFATAVENYSNVYVPEALLQLQTTDFAEAEETGDSRAKLSVGRHLETWSQLDRNWDLGMWEPLNRFDALRPIDQGLTGAFLEFGTGRVKAILFGSPIYIPEQGGSFSIQNGKFRTSSPWFVEPTDQLIIFKERAEVRYDLLTPTTGSVINHASAGALLRYGRLDSGFYAQASYAMKPRNQLATPFEAAFNLTDTTSYAGVQIEPQVVYHQLSGAEIGYVLTRADGSKSVAIGMSALLDSPINEPAGPNLTYQELDPLLMLSPTLSKGFVLGRATALDLSVSYLSSAGGGFTMRGPWASERAVFGTRVPFREAIAVDGRLRIGQGRRTTFTLGTRWLEELAENGSLLSADANLDFSMNGQTQDWRVSLMADVLGSRLAPNENVGYVSRYRGNDRWMSQLRFIF